MRLLNIARALRLLWDLPMTRAEYRNRLTGAQVDEFDRWVVSIREVSSFMRHGKASPSWYPGVAEWVSAHPGEPGQSFETSFALPGGKATHVRVLMRHNTPFLNRFWTTDPVGHFEMWCDA